MTSQQQSGSSLYRGWIMTGVAFLSLIFVFGAPTAIMPMIYGPIIHEFHWSRAAATAATSWKNGMSALMAIFVVGPFLDRFGLRALFVLSCFAVGIGMVGFMWVGDLTTYYLASAMIGVGTATVMIAAKVLVSRWFIRNQGLATSIAAIGTSVGGVIFPLLGAVLIEHVGWRWTVALVSLGIWVIALPVYLMVARENPTEEDIAPDAPIGIKGDAQMQEKLRAADVDLTFGQLLRRPMFWLVTTGVMLASAADAGVFQNTILFLENDVGLAKNLAALSLSGVFAFGIIAKLMAGWVFDRFALKGIVFWYLLLAISILCAFTATGLYTVLLFTLARGIAHGGLISEGPVVAKQCFGPRHLNKTLPIFVGAYSIGASLGPVFLSYTRDVTGSYHTGFAVAIGACLVAALLLAWVKPLYWLNLRALSRGER
jgi:MFS family permease